MGEIVNIRKVGRPGVPLREANVDDIATLTVWQNGLNEELARRANLIFCMLDGMTVKDAAISAGVANKTAYKWRTRWNLGGAAELTTRSYRMQSERYGFVKTSLRRKIEQMMDPDIGPSELKGLALQLARDQPRDDPTGTSNSHSRVKLGCLQLVKEIIKLEQAGKGGKTSLAQLLAEDP